MHQHINTSIHQHTNASSQVINTSIHQHTNTSTQSPTSTQSSQQINTIIDINTSVHVLFCRKHFQTKEFTLFEKHMKRDRISPEISNREIIIHQTSHTEFWDSVLNPAIRLAEFTGIFCRLTTLKS